MAIKNVSNDKATACDAGTESDCLLSGISRLDASHESVEGSGSDSEWKRRKCLVDRTDSTKTLCQDTCVKRERNYSQSKQMATVEISQMNFCCAPEAR